MSYRLLETRPGVEPGKSIGFASRRPHRREPRPGTSGRGGIRTRGLLFDGQASTPLLRTTLMGAWTGSADGIRTRRHRIESPAALSVLPTAPCASPGIRTRSRPLRRRLLILLSLRRTVPPRGLEPLHSGLKGRCPSCRARAARIRTTSCAVRVSISVPRGKSPVHHPSCLRRSNGLSPTSGWLDSNQRPPGSKPGAHSKLRHIPCGRRVRPEPYPGFEPGSPAWKAGASTASACTA